MVLSTQASSQIDVGSRLKTAAVVFAALPFQVPDAAQEDPDAAPIAGRDIVKQPKPVFQELPIDEKVVNKLAAVVKFQRNTMKTMEYRLAVKHIENYNSGQAQVLSLLNSLLDTLSPEKSYNAFYLPPKSAKMVREAVLDSIIANFQRLTGTKDFALFHHFESMPEAFSSSYKQFFTHLSNRVNELKQDDSAVMEMTSGVPSSTLNKQKFFKKRTAGIVRALTARHMIEVAKRYNKNLDKSDEDRREKVVSAKAFTKKFVRPYNALAKQLELADQPIDELPAWEEIFAQLKKASRIRANFRKQSQACAALMFAADAVSATLAADNKELVGRLPVAYRSEIAPYLQGTFSQHLRKGLDERVELSTVSKESLKALFRTIVKPSNLYQQVIDKHNLFAANKNHPAFQETAERWLTSKPESLAWFLFHRDEFKTPDNRLDFTSLDSVKLGPETAAGQYRTITADVEPLANNAAYAEYMNGAITSHLVEQANEFLRKRGHKNVQLPEAFRDFGLFAGWLRKEADEVTVFSSRILDGIRNPEKISATKLTELQRRDTKQSSYC
eukprot:Gregarina_sp_Poly_1__8386@NODE_491_length_7964_cov_12_375332_g395_i0_p2_GENE_NODE_491_length_7964_cov_12_375332_g395_i0NODE_491_length_7964_cov_12_375332_g395_i0_p2_ORF_typecomplete_len557_score92_30_NODE_491_length_7964_cov_12_375332_g395_i062387908